MPKKYRKFTERKNLTLRVATIRSLESISDFSGLTQSEVMDLAFVQPEMYRLREFVCGSRGHAVADLLDAYQVKEAGMRPGLGEEILYSVLDHYLFDCGYLDLDASVVAQVNEYVATHMPAGSRKASRLVDAMYKNAVDGCFVTGKEVQDRDTVRRLISVMLDGKDDERLMGEAYLFRDLVVIFELMFALPSEECKRKMYNGFLRSGKVFGFVR